MYKKYSKNVGNGSYLSTEFTVIACRSPYAVFLGRHSAREIHSIALDETHDKNVASFSVVFFRGTRGNGDISETHFILYISS